MPLTISGDLYQGARCMLALLGVGEGFKAGVLVTLKKWHSHQTLCRPEQCAQCYLSVLGAAMTSLSCPHQQISKARHLWTSSRRIPQSGLELCCPGCCRRMRNGADKSPMHYNHLNSES